MLAIVRLLVIFLVLGTLVLGSMLALAELVEPEQREMSVTIPATRFNK